MRHFRVLDILTAADRQRFHAMLDDPAWTINAAHAWMTRQGYRVSRGAAANYMRSIRRGALAELSRSMAGLSDASARTRIARILPRLRGRELIYLASQAEFMVRVLENQTSNCHLPQGGDPERHGRRSDRLPGRPVAA